MSNRNKRNRILIIAAALLIAAGAFVYMVLSSRNTFDGMDWEHYQQKDTTWEDTIVYQGKTYRRRNDLKTMLFLGVDDTQQIQREGVVGNRGRTDTLMLFILDRTNKTIRLLDISRDSMTNVDVFDDKGNYVLTGNMQINMQYAFGSDDRSSCQLTEKRVSDLLYGIPINYDLALKLGGISTLTDLLGGITVTLPEDYTEINAAYHKGAVVTMNGKHAEGFVRYRDTDQLGSNSTRMQRQSWFVSELIRQVQQDDEMFDRLLRFVEKGDKDLYTNIDTKMLDRLSSYTLEEEIHTVPGETKAGVSTDEFYVDEEALRGLIVELFYEPTND